jgi:hypothetical protein
LPFNLLEAGFKAGAIAAGLTFFAVAMLLFPRAACDKMTGECLAFIHRTGKGSGAESLSDRGHKLVSFLRGLMI